MSGFQTVLSKIERVLDENEAYFTLSLCLWLGFRHFLVFSQVQGVDVENRSGLLESQIVRR